MSIKILTCPDTGVKVRSNGDTHIAYCRIDEWNVWAAFEVDENFDIVEDSEINISTYNQYRKRDLVKVVEERLAA